jgi:hypothetical protein
MSNLEKRKTKRREILDRFSFYVCIPRLGYSRHKVKDISELGIGFEIETLGEFKLTTGEVCELQFYLNQSLYLPLQIQVVRQIDRDSTQEVGATFSGQSSNAHATFTTLVKLVDQLGEFAEIPNF